MTAPHITLVEALYKIHVEGLNPGMSVEEARKLSENLQLQYKDAIAEAKKLDPHTWNGVRDNSK